MQTIVFHRFAYTCCTASFQPFYGMFAIRYNMLSDRAFLQVCYRTLVEYKGSGFLGISMVCGMFFLFQKVLNCRKSVIEAENFCGIYVWFAWKSVREWGDIRWKKCNRSDSFVWKSVKLYALYLFLALILTFQSSLNYTHTDIISNICVNFVPEKV